uniref:Uncharacterized protein n=1 Tax=Strongyloides papillosus TaxID=174720 RepID=A0A0N5B6K8_STREA
MILTLFLLNIYFLFVMAGETNNMIYYNNRNVNKKFYRKSNSPSSSILYTSRFQLKNRNNNAINQPVKKQSYTKTKQNFRYYAIATQPVSKKAPLQTLPNIKYTYTKHVPYQYYYKNTNVGPTLPYKYNINSNYARPYQYNYYQRSPYYTPYYYNYYSRPQTPQYNYYSTPQTSQYNYYSTPQTSQYNYAPKPSPLLSALQQEYTYPHKGHGFFGNELAQFWIVCHDCPRG